MVKSTKAKEIDYMDALQIFRREEAPAHVNSLVTFLNMMHGTDLTVRQVRGERPTHIDFRLRRFDQRFEIMAAPSHGFGRFVGRREPWLVLDLASQRIGNGTGDAAEFVSQATLSRPADEVAALTTPAPTLGVIQHRVLGAGLLPPQLIVDVATMIVEARDKRLLALPRAKGVRQAATFHT